eukprot:scaffold3295_cov196-Skeletonema_marinoi.AAC.5
MSCPQTQSLTLLLQPLEAGYRFVLQSTQVIPCSTTEAFAVCCDVFERTKKLGLSSSDALVVR